ncbi:COBW domain-containing protein [Purpureocillium lilacinum]|uniref:COBW domain-containing protein n=1 Tax=Purpureocillium lilacinum TaxID=33203 RepID=A0A179HDR7_PURLI|nr:COBW domain-containing protein [Purpureocillium lilacinum]OAQ88154.1 COBW domain-containing protein [Purpureocillium lilacinum]
MASPESPAAATATATEPFPAIDGTAPGPLAQSPSADDSRSATTNRPAASSSLSGHLRRASVTFSQSELPEGFFAAAGGIASSVFSRQNVARPGSSAPSSPVVQSPEARQTIPEHSNGTPPFSEEPGSREPKTEGSSASQTTSMPIDEPAAAAPFPNGYHFPPKHSFGQSMKLGSISFWHYFMTPLGFVVTIYGLNVVAWGGMLFLLLCNASPAMCHPTCDDINSPRRIWIEIDSQILNALFCVTGFGLAPWRFRDLYFLLRYRLQHREEALRRLAGIHRGWFRLEGSAALPINIGPKNVEQHLSQAASRPAVPFPATKIPDVPLTGVRAPPTKLWKLDLVIWLMVWNTFLQCVLSGFMWGLNRYDRPSWSTGLFVALGCTVAAVGGLIMFLEGKSVKGIEGVPVSQQDLEQLESDRERGVWHYNNIKDEDLEAKRKKEEEKKRKHENRSHHHQHQYCHRYRYRYHHHQTLTGAVASPALLLLQLSPFLFNTISRLQPAGPQPELDIVIGIVIGIDSQPTPLSQLT